MARKRVLAVDDEPELLNVFRERLQGRYDIDTAVCATEAVQALERTRPDVLLLDINMPGMDGLTLLTFVRKTHAKLPVIVITGNMDHRVSQKCLEQGAFAFAPKPLHLNYLDHLVASAVGQHA